MTTSLFDFRSFSPLKTDQSLSCNWRVKKTYKDKLKLQIYNEWTRKKPTIVLPISVDLIRYSPRKLDDDNLIYAFKPVRDILAQLIFPGSKSGQKDNSPLISWHYAQAKGVMGYQITINTLLQE